MASGLISTIVPKAIYDPSTGAILGGAFGGGGPGPAAPVAIAPVGAYAYPAGNVYTDIRTTSAFGGRARFPEMASYASVYGPAMGEPIPGLRSDLGGLPVESYGTAGRFGLVGPAGGAVAGMSMIGPIGGAIATYAGRAIIPAIERVVPKWVLQLAGGAVATEVYNLYIQHRTAGHKHARAKRLALQGRGFTVKRRRMRPTNVHALRRAIRRVRGARRILRKVHGLNPPQHRGGWGGRMVRRKRYRRGDVSPFAVEDYMDARDEWEDLDDEETSFPDDAAVAAE